MTEAKTGSSNGRAERGRMPERNGQGVERDAQPVQSKRRLIDHRPGAEQSPVQARAAQALEVDPVRPVGGLHLGQLDAAAAGRVDIEERCAREKPADRLLRRRKRVDAGNEPVEQADERVAVGDVAGAIDQRVLPSDQIKRHERAEIACMH